MDDPEKKLELPSLAIKAERAMKEAVAAAIAEHWRAGRPVHIWKDEQVMALYPDGTAIPVERSREPARQKKPNRDSRDSRDARDKKS
jgi:hypothetical protein